MIALVVMLGGCQMNQDETISNEELRNEQNRMVEFVATHYEDIQKVEFTEMEENKMTGAFDFYAKINGDIIVDFTLWGQNGDITMSERTSRNNGKLLIKRSSVAQSNVQSEIDITYLEEWDDN